MALPDVTVSGRGVKITGPIRKYIEEKIGKYSEIYSSIVTSIEVVCIQTVASRGVKGDFKVQIFAYLPKVTARVEKEGADLYGLIDLATDVLIRKVKRYKDQYRKWEGKDKWVTVKNSDRGTEEGSFVSYTPKVSKTKIVKKGVPIMPEEAIERMEMNDYDTFLFKDSKTGFCSMVYRRKDRTYGLIQLQSEEE